MPKKATAKERRHTTGKLNDGVKEYIDGVTMKIHDELISKLNVIDNRDKAQYDAAKKIILDTNAVFDRRQQTIEDTVSRMEIALNTVQKERETTDIKLTTSIANIHREFRTHIHDETDEFKQIASNQLNMATNIADIQTTLNTVSANGNKGLHASLRDLYEKNSEVHTDLKEIKILLAPALDRHQWWESTKKVFKTSGIFTIVKSKVGRLVLLLCILLLVNTVLHPFFGGNFDLQSILEFFGIGKG